jgi:hypothetical protein
MAYIKQLQLNNEDICPLTHESAVVDSNGVSLSSKLDNYYNKTETYSKSEVDTKTSELSREIDNEVTNRKNAITDLESKMNQLSLNIAEGDTLEEAIEWLNENGNTSLLYLMPDNYFYQYRYVEGTSVISYTNQLPLATDPNGAIYNGVGYKDGVRVGSDGTDRTGAPTDATGFIPCKEGDIIRFKNCQLIDSASYNGFVFYTKSKALIGNNIGISSVTMQLWGGVFDDNKNLTQVCTKLPASSSWDFSNLGFIRFYGNYIGADSIITINQEIKESTTQGGYQWVNTGRSLIETDNEDRIIALERNDTNQDTRIEILEDTIKNADGVPSYVITESKEVADKIIEKRTINSLVLLMGSDLHVSANETTKTAIQHMGMGMNLICDYTTPNGVIFLGDYNYGTTPQSTAQGIEDMKLCRSYVSEVIKRIPSIWLNGNHDYYGISSSEPQYRLSENMVYSLVGSHNTDKAIVDVDNLGRNYGYVDFEKQRIRLIYLNTTDINGVDYTSHLISTAQGQWFINKALNLSDKENEEKWGVVVCAHIPLFDNPQIPTVLGKFKDKASGGSNFGMTYNFSNVKADLIAVFHGHIHNFKVTQKSTPGGNTIKYICIPNALPSRENPYTTTDYREVDSNGNAVSYPKTPNSSEDTSFNAIIIDKDNKKIHAICYGAGVDREINY